MGPGMMGPGYTTPGPEVDKEKAAAYNQAVQNHDKEAVICGRKSGPAAGEDDPKIPGFPVPGEYSPRMKDYFSFPSRSPRAKHTRFDPYASQRMEYKNGGW